MVPPNYSPDAEQVCPLKGLFAVDRKEFKVIQEDTECGWGLMSQWGRTGRWRNVPTQ